MNHCAGGGNALDPLRKKCAKMRKNAQKCAKKCAKNAQKRDLEKFLFDIPGGNVFPTAGFRAFVSCSAYAHCSVHKVPLSVHKKQDVIFFSRKRKIPCSGLLWLKKKRPEEKMPFFCLCEEKMPIFWLCKEKRVKNHHFSCKIAKSVTKFCPV